MWRTDCVKWVQSSLRIFRQCGPRGGYPTTCRIQQLSIQLLDGQRGVAAGYVKTMNVPFIIHSGYDAAFQAPAFHDARPT
ncbi:hypothetical protein ORS3428_21865 [Mesorhizobium sp. ORS 3428]|nr:hypothetical protein ORS3428_21865 [Mesorhizobium sp. ORS 3428]